MHLANVVRERVEEVRRACRPNQDLVVAIQAAADLGLAMADLADSMARWAEMERRRGWAACRWCEGTGWQRQVTGPCPVCNPDALPSVAEQEKLRLGLGGRHHPSVHDGGTAQRCPACDPNLTAGGRAE